MSRFVRPETVVLPISHGDSLIVRKRLSAGEQRASFARMYMPVEGGAMRVNTLHVGVARVLAYLIDWTLTDDEGHQVEIRGLPLDELQAVIDNLDPESFEEIHRAIQAHEAAMAAERSAEKKTDGTNRSAATSASPSDAAGDMNGSQSLTLTSIQS